MKTDAEVYAIRERARAENNRDALDALNECDKARAETTKLRAQYKYALEELADLRKRTAPPAECASCRMWMDLFKAEQAKVDAALEALGRDRDEDGDRE